MTKKNIGNSAVEVFEGFGNKMQTLFSELHTHRKTYATLCSVLAAIATMNGYGGMACYLSAAAASLTTWSLVLPKKE